jgi:hypothetical protein
MDLCTQTSDYKEKCPFMFHCFFGGDLLELGSKRGTGKVRWPGGVYNKASATKRCVLDTPFHLPHIRAWWPIYPSRL